MTSNLDDNFNPFLRAVTATKLLNITDFFHCATDLGQTSILIILELSAAFDIIDFKPRSSVVRSVSFRIYFLPLGLLLWCLNLFFFTSFQTTGKLYLLHPCFFSRYCRYYYHCLSYNTMPLLSTKRRSLKGQIPKYFMYPAQYLFKSHNTNRITSLINKITPIVAIIHIILITLLSYT